jgi:outer membrane cobalamin receptor
MIRKLIILKLFLILLVSAGFTQPENIRIEVSDVPLNHVLLQLREKYGFQLSYNENQASRYRVTLSESFISKEKALQFILNGLPFQFKKIDEVFVIIPEKKKPKVVPKKDQTIITGQIVEAGSSEPLPFSQIMINNHPMISDVTGNFNFLSDDQNSFRVRISHLGYYIYDTLVYAGINQQFKLFPSTLTLPEIVVQENKVEKATMLGEKAGKITINHNIARFLPGQGDNSVFNLIRLMPGIQAAGEQSEDLLIWGSYEGQNLVTFDEFTLFGLKNYNDNISVVNPFLVKNIEILKGGFESKYGNRVGGIVNITAKSGNMQKPVFSLNINPTTLNGMLELPMFGKSSLQLAYRQTYYNLYQSGDFNIFAPTRQTSGKGGNSFFRKNVSFDTEVLPDNYEFRDMNLKYTLNFDRGDQFYVSMYGGGDFFSLLSDASISREMNQSGKNLTLFNVTMQDDEKNLQYGASAFYARKWSDKLASKFVVTHSDFSKKLTDDIHVVISATGKTLNKYQVDLTNTALENSIRVENTFTLLNGHQLEFGAGFYNNEAEIDLANVPPVNLLSESQILYRSKRIFGYFQDNLPVGDHLLVRAGIRLSKSSGRGNSVVEPRISASYKFNDQLKFNASWGRYHQYIYKVANIDRSQNYTYLWVTNNDNVIPLLNAIHWVGEFNYFKNDLTLNLQAYFKPTHNLTERVYEQTSVKGVKTEGYYPYYGDSKTFGIDLFARKEFGKHSVWASYTLSKALERFAPLNSRLPEYTLAPQHQMHEFKVAALFNVHAFYFSANYIYGSGLEVLSKVFGSDANTAYSRVDVASTYKFSPKWVSGELGFSFLNIFDTQNLRYANLKNFQLSQELGDFRVYSSSVPFTPVLFLKLVF